MKLGQGNIFRSVCQEFCPQGPCACQRGVCGRGMHGRGACIAGCVWWGACQNFCPWEACMSGRCAWQGGMCGRGACMAGEHDMAGGCAWRGGNVCGKRSMSRRYVSYWNAFLFKLLVWFTNRTVHLHRTFVFHFGRNQNRTRFM